MSREHDHWVRRIYEHLEAAGDWCRGYGWQSFVNRKLERSHGFVYQGLRRKNLQVSTLVEILGALDYKVPDFLAEIIGGSADLDPLARLLERGRQLQPDLPQVILDVKKRLDRGGKSLCSPPSPTERQWVDSIAEARFEDPAGAAATVEATLGDLLAQTSDRNELSLGIPLLAEWASARRRCDDPDSFLWVLLHCWRWAQATGEHALKGDLLQRLARSCTDHFGDYKGALRLSNWAMVEHTMAQNQAGIGRTLVDRGIWLFYLERYMESIEANRLASEMLPAKEARHRIASLTNQAAGYRLLENQEQLELSIQRAWSLGPKKLERASLHWMEGTLAAETDRFSAAETAFHESCRIFEQSSPVNTALVSLELINLYLRQGRTSESLELARHMARLIWPLRRFPIAEAAVSDLVRKATQSQLSESLLLITRRKILRARVRSDCSPQARGK